MYYELYSGFRYGLELKYETASDIVCRDFLKIQVLGQILGYWLLNVNLCQCTIGHFGWRDTDGDGIPDPIDTISFNVRTFSPWSGYAIPNGLWLVGDFNGDCIEDILHAVQNSDYTHPWLSRGDGTFNVRTFSPWSGYAIPNGLWLVGDFDKDNRCDILHAVQNSDYTHPWLSSGR